MKFKRSGRVNSKRRDRDEAMQKEYEYGKLKRKLRIMENDSQNYSQEVNNILRKQGKEIRMLEKENGHMYESLSVAFGKYHLERDIDNTKSLKEMVEAGEDYKLLIGVEASYCKDLDVKIKTIRDQVVDIKMQIGNEETERERELTTKRYIARLENQVNKFTSDFCTKLHENAQMKDKIKLLIKEKDIYHDLYSRLAERISSYKKRIMDATQEASGHYEQRLEAIAKMKALKDRSTKDESVFQAEMKVLQRMIAHDTKIKEFMRTKENERLNLKAEEAEKRTRMSIKEKVLNEESQHVQKYENLFENVQQVTGHLNIDKVVHEFKDKDEENFARFDYVSELNHDVEKLREEIQHIKDNIKKLKREDAQMSTGSDKTVADLKNTRETLEKELSVEEAKLAQVSEKMDVICGSVHVLFKSINCNTDAFKTSLAFEDKVTAENITTYLGIIEQRFMELICILQFIGLHQDHHGNLLRVARSIHRIRPRGQSKIFYTTTDQPAIPSVNTPNIIDEFNTENLVIDDASFPMDVNTLREKVMQKIAKKEAAGLLNQPLFVHDKRKSKKK